MSIVKRAAMAVAGALSCTFAVAAEADQGGDAGSQGPVPYGTIPVNSQSAPGYPPPPPTGLGAVVELDGEFGGDKIATIYYEDSSDQSVRTGQGLTGAVGAHYRTFSNWDFRGTVGYKYVSTKASNANIYVGRVVFAAAADYFFNDKWFVGAGGLYHTGIEFHGDDIAPNLKFKDAAGVKIEAGWWFASLTYTFMDYKDEDGFKYNANNIGLSFMWRF